MTKTLLQQLPTIMRNDVLQHIDGAEIVDRGYSGRGMYGRTCFAIRGTHRECQFAIAQCIFVMHQAVLEDYEETGGRSTLVEQFAEAVHAIMSFRVDNLGFDWVYYWEDIPHEVAEE